MAIKVAINGYGRIGRNVLRAALGKGELEFVAHGGGEALGADHHHRLELVAEAAQVAFLFFCECRHSGNCRVRFAKAGEYIIVIRSLQCGGQSL